MCYLCEATEQVMLQPKRNAYIRESGGKAPAAGRFLWFFGSESHFNAIAITFWTFLEQKLNCWNFDILLLSGQEVDFASVIAMNFMCY